MKANKIKLSPYQITLLSIWGASLFLLTVGYFGFHGPQKIEQRRVQQNLSESNDILALAKKAATPGTLDLLQQKCDLAQQSIDDYSIKKENVTGLVFDIGQIANQLELTEYSSEIREKISFPTVAKSKVLEEGWVDVRFEGSFKQFAEFINQLERNHPVVFVEKVLLQRVPEDPDRNEAAIELSFLTTKPEKPRPVATAK